ncbi:MAG: hypothetical protein ACE5D8_04575 [Fidelibacterota bacterium]
MRILLLALFLLTGGISQETDSGLTLERYPILILPAIGDSTNAPIAEDLTRLLSTEATALQRFNVIDHTQLESVLAEQALQMSGIVRDEDVVEFGRLAAAREALVLRVLNFGQKGVPPEDEEEEDEKDRAKAREYGLFGIVVKGIVDAIVDKELEDVERYPDNIQTIIQAEVSKLDIESGKSVASFKVVVLHTGGNRDKSLSAALSQAAREMSSELRKLYLLNSEVLEVNGDEVTLLLGKNLGIRPGIQFDIVSRPQERQLRGRSITLPGRSVGRVLVETVSPDASQGRILRYWEPLQPGYRAVETLKPVVGLGMTLTLAPDIRFYRLQVLPNPLPFQKFIIQGLFSLGMMKDTRNDMDFSLGFGLQLGHNVYYHSQRALGITVSLPLHVAFRSDDESNMVAMPVFAPGIGAVLKFQMDRRRDLILAIDVVSMSTTGRWKYSKDNEDGNTDTFDAIWHDTTPDIRPEGLYFSVGYRFLTL